MFKSRPLYLLVMTLCLLVLVVASYWLALSPQRTLQELKAEILNSTGHVLDVRATRVNFTDGFSVTLDNVVLTDPNDPGFSFSAQSIKLPGLFSDKIVVDWALIDIDITSLQLKNLNIPQQIQLNDAVLKLRDPARKSVVAITDINGDISVDTSQAVKGQLAMVWGTQITDLSFTIDDADRFVTSGSPMDLTLKSKAMVSSFSGQGRINTGFELAGEMTAIAPDAASFMRWFGMPLESFEGLGALSLQSGVSTIGLSLSLDKFKGLFAGSDVAGQLKLAAGPDRSILSGVVSVSKLALWGPKMIASTLSKPWSEKPLPLADITALDLDLRFKADAFVLRGRDLGDVAFEVKSEDNGIDISFEDQKIANGQGTLKARFAKISNAMKVDISSSVTDVSSLTFFGGVFGFDALDGKVALKAEINATGQSTAELVSTLQGQIEFKGKEVTLPLIDAAALLSKPQKGWGVLPSDARNKASISFAASAFEGVATLKPSDITTEAVSIAPRGEIDLLRQAFALRLSPKGKGTVANMSLSGPWTTPIFSPENAVKEKTTMTPPAN